MSLRDLVPKFNNAIESKDINKIYNVSIKIAKIYTCIYTRRYNCKNVIDQEDLSQETVFQMLRVIKEKPNMESRYYFGVIKNESNWLIIKNLRKNPNEIFLSELLDVEEHKYPETMMRSVNELAKETPQYLTERKVTSVLVEYADMFYSIKETADMCNVGINIIRTLAYKYNINFIDGKSKIKKQLYENRKNDIYLYNKNKITEKELSEKWGINEHSVKYYITGVSEEKKYIDEMGCWNYVYNQFSVKSFQDLTLIQRYRGIYVPKENYNKEKELMEYKQEYIKRHKYYEDNIQYHKKHYELYLKEYNELRKKIGMEEIIFVD